jgi:prepilin-type cleavage/methylation N-terminal domain protein
MNKKGFTLTELIVVIVIIGLVLLIVIPVSSNIMQNNAEEKGKFYVQTLENAVNTYCDMYKTNNVEFSELETEGLFSKNSNRVSSDDLTDASFQISLAGEVQIKKATETTYSSILLDVTINGTEYTCDKTKCEKK